MKPSVGDAVRVEWVDSMARVGWGDVPSSEMACFSVGFLVKQAKDRVVIAMNYSLPDEHDRATHGQYMTIPTVAIQRVSVLERNAVREKKK